MKWYGQGRNPYEYKTDDSHRYQQDALEDLRKENAKLRKEIKLLKELLKLKEE